MSSDIKDIRKQLRDGIRSKPKRPKRHKMVYRKPSSEPVSGADLGLHRGDLGERVTLVDGRTFKCVKAGRPGKWVPLEWPTAVGDAAWAEDKDHGG